MEMTVKCERCGIDLAGDDPYHYRGQDLCEDCYMGALQAPKTCDVAATHLARKHRESTGQSGTDGLLEIQRNIHDYIARRGRATREEILEEFSLPSWELDKQVAVLRHCELVKGRKENDQVYLVLYDA